MRLLLMMAIVWLLAAGITLAFFIAIADAYRDKDHPDPVADDEEKWSKPSYPHAESMGTSLLGEVEPWVMRRIFYAQLRSGWRDA